MFILRFELLFLHMNHCSYVYITTLSAYVNIQFAFFYFQLRCRLFSFLAAKKGIGALQQGSDSVFLIPDSILILISALIS